MKQRGVFISGCIWSTPKILLGIVNTMVVTYISFYATDVLGMLPGVIATVLLIAKLLDGVTDLIAGFLIDNTHTRFGKARPYDLGIPFVAVFLILLFSTPNVGSGLQAVYIGIMYTILQILAATLLGASDSVYLLQAFREEKQRNSVYSISLIVSNLISITLGIIIPTLVACAGNSHTAWTKMVLIISVPFAIIGMIRFFMIKEDTNHLEEIPKGKVEKKAKEKVSASDGFKAIFTNKYILVFTLSVFIIVISSGFLNTSLAYYFKYFVGDQSKMAIANISAFGSIAMLVLFMPLANKFGKDRVMKMCLFILCIGNVVRWIGGTNMITIVIGMTLLFIGIVPLAMYFPLYIFDIMDYSEWKTGTRVEGVLAVFPIFATKVAGGLAVSLGSFILGWAGYDGTRAVQSDLSMVAINLCFNVIPTIICFVMTIFMFFFYDIDKIMPTVKKELEERKIVDEK
jgi:Na+/melibiose symporter and related transporters